MVGIDWAVANPPVGSFVIKPLLPSVIEPLPAAPRRLSDDLRLLERESAGRTLTIGELEIVLQGRGLTLLILLMALPFCMPFAIPGLSIPFGVVIVLIGLRIVFGQKPALPKRILKTKVKAEILAKIVSIGLKLCVRLEKLARPRMSFMRTLPGMTNLIGIGLTSGGIQLLLPLPPLIPLSNTIPAVSVVLLTVGMIERDGVFVLLGFAVNLFAWAYFIFMFVMGVEGMRMIGRWFGL